MTFLLRWSNGESCDDKLSQEGLAESVNTHHNRDLLTPAGFPEQELTVGWERQPGNSFPILPWKSPSTHVAWRPDGRTQGLPSWGLDASHCRSPPPPGLLAPAPEHCLPPKTPHRLVPWPCHLPGRVAQVCSGAEPVHRAPQRPPGPPESELAGEVGEGHPFSLVQLPVLFMKEKKHHLHLHLFSFSDKIYFRTEVCVPLYHARLPPAFGHGLLRGWLQLWPGLSLQHAQSWAGVRPWERLRLWQAHGSLINKSVRAPQVACCCLGG